MDEEILAYFLRERERIRTRLGILRSGRAWTSEMHNDEPVDTTTQTLSALEESLEEIATLLSTAAVHSE